MTAKTYPEEEYSSLFLSLAPPIEKTTDTDALGRYEIDLKWPFAYHVIAVKEGWATAAARAMAGERLDFFLEPEASLTVLVTSPDGEPVPGARVRLRFDERSFPEITSFTKKDGRAKFPGLSAGDLAVVADHSLFCRAKEELLLEVGERLEVELELAAGGTVAGVIRDWLTGLPIPGARVSLHYLEHHAVTSDEGGKYRLEGVPLRGTWDIHVEAEGYGKVTEFVGFGESLEPVELDFELDRGRALSGRVLDERGAVVERARIVAFGYYGNRSGGAVDADSVACQSDADGRFRLAWLRTDIKHTVMISHPGFARRALTVLPGEEKDIDLGEITLDEAFVLEGAVTDEAGLKLGGLELTLIHAPFPEVESAGRDMSYTNIGNLMPSVFTRQSCATREDGTFAFSGLSRGTYRIETERDPYLATLRQINVGQDTDFLRLSVERGARLEGRIRDSEGAPIQHARVSLRWVKGESAPQDAVFETARVLSKKDGSHPAVNTVWRVGSTVPMCVTARGNDFYPSGCPKKR